MISIKILNALKIPRTYDPDEDTRKVLEALKDNPNIGELISLIEKDKKPFSRFFSNYGTGIGETIEEVVGIRFKEFIPKYFPKIGKKGQTLKSKIKNKVYTDYNKRTGKKPTNYDHLALFDAELASWEVKVIRSAEARPKQDSKLYEIPSPLEERSLSFKDSSKSANVSFQQTKPDLFEFLLGVVLYNDQVDFYIVPSKDIKSGKLRLGNQHNGAIKKDGSTNEGHLFLSDLKSYKVKTVYTEEELLSSDSLLNYI